MTIPVLLPDSFDVSLLKSILYELTSGSKPFNRSTVFTDCPKDYRQLVDIYLHEAGIGIIDKHVYGSVSVTYKLHHPQELGITVDDFCKTITDQLYKKRMAQLLEESKPKPPSNRTINKPVVKPSIDKYVIISLIVLNAIQFVIILALIFGAKS